MVQHDTYIGKEIGNYCIEREIASGSFGNVYLARHLHLKQRTVVIKILHALRLGSEQEKEQFLLEAQILETLKGLPNILPLLDVGIDDHVPYMIAEYAEQGSLRMYMQQHGTPLPVPEALRIIEQVGHGLENAHKQGIVHCDLKPENILFNAKGEALLADFGLSTILSTASVTRTRIEGTPAYMAPEQFEGEVSKESDQYALACVAYELLTGRKLFEAPSSVSMGFLHTTKAPTPPCQLNPQIPAPVEHALLIALSKDRTKRYPGISAFIASLNAFDDSPTLLLAQSTPISSALPPILPGTSNSRTLSTSSTIPGEPTPALYPPAPNMTATSAISKSVTSGTLPPMPTYPAGPGQAWSTSSPYTASPKRNSPAPLIIALIIVTLLVLGGSSLAAIAYFGLSLSAGPPSLATISITPLSKTVQDTYVMQGVTDNANANNSAVTVRQLTSTRTATDMVNATGHTQVAAVAATGILTFENFHNSSYTVPGGTAISGPNGTTIITDSDAVIPAANLGIGNTGSANVNAHITPNGTIGNIAALTVNKACGCDKTGGVIVRNPNAFTGGQDAQDYHFLQQSDIASVTNAHQATLQSNAQNNIKGQIKSNEQLLGDIICDNAQTTEDVQPGDQGSAKAVTSAHVTVSVTCNAQVYDANAVQTMAQNALQQKAGQDLGTGYVLVGRIVTQTQTPQLQDGSITFPVTASGIWSYQWTDAIKHDLLNKIKGQTKAQTQTILTSYPGISHATIDITNSGTTLPSNPTQIKLIVNTIKGL